jgi:hypothetical protein
MPRTKFQDLAFTVIMVVVMVYCMTLYNVALEIGLTYQTFWIALTYMWKEALAAFIAQRYVAAPLIRRIMESLFSPGEAGKRLRIVAIAGCNVMLMAPMMTLIVSAMHHGITPELPLQWLPKLLVNFPFALVIQIFYVGPLVRLIFRTLFRKQLMQAEA